LADTGCPADLIGLNDMTAGDIERIETAAEPICFSTANGPVWASSTLPLQGMALMEEINPYVMEQTPAVLSIGRRCMLHGYSFHWPSAKSPYFIKPGGEKIVCDVHSYVPYLKHRDPTWSERAAAAPATANLADGAVLRRPRFAEFPSPETEINAGGGHAPAPRVLMPRTRATRSPRTHKLRTIERSMPLSRGAVTSRTPPRRPCP